MTRPKKARMTRPKDARMGILKTMAQLAQMSFDSQSFETALALRFGYGLTDKKITAFLSADEKSKREDDLLFAGNDNPPDDECEIIFNDRLTFEQKMAKLNALRARKRINKQIKRTDRLHAHALGVRL